MPVKSIVDDYLLAAMLRAKGTRAENGMLVLIVPDFPGIIASGADARQALSELYRLLDEWVEISLEKGYHLPPLATDAGVIDLTTSDGRTLAMYRKGRLQVRSAPDRIHVGGPEEFEVFLEDLLKSD